MFHDLPANPQESSFFDVFVLCWFYARSMFIHAVGRLDAGPEAGKWRICAIPDSCLQHTTGGVLVTKRSRCRANGGLLRFSGESPAGARVGQSWRLCPGGGRGVIHRLGCFVVIKLRGMAVGGELSTG
mgnify:FL=1